MGSYSDGDRTEYGWTRYGTGHPTFLWVHCRVCFTRMVRRQTRPEKLFKGWTETYDPPVFVRKTGREVLVYILSEDGLCGHRP